MFEERLSPAKVSAAAAAKLPRWLLVGLLAAYIVPGLFGRDPWTLKDAASFGVMWTMAQGTAADWWLPNVAGAANFETGPLGGWVGAGLIQAFGPWLGGPTAARLSIVVWFVISTAALWYGVFRLARREEAQPVAFAFGGEASPRDYGRAIADVAVLLLVATFGILVRMHEAVPETVSLATASVCFFGLVWSLDRPVAGSLLAGAAAGATLLATGLLPALTLWLACVCVFLVTPGARAGRAVLCSGSLLAVGALWQLGAWWVAGVAAEPWMRIWWADNLADFGSPGVAGLAWLGRNFAWYTWPLWPFAAWAVYSWRHGPRVAHIALPLAWLGAVGLGMLVSTSIGDAQMLLLVPPLVALAAFGVPTLRRGAENAIDWFSVALFSLVSLALWLYFVAWATGWPPKMHASLTRFAPGTSAEVHPVYFFAAITATVLWIAVVLWRIRHRPQMLWCGPWIAAAGLTMAWVLTTGLFREAVDVNRAYGPAARGLAAQLANSGAGVDDCVRTWHVPPGVRAMLAYHGKLRFEADAALGSCRYLLHRDAQRNVFDDALPPGQWEVIAEVRPRTRSDEVFRLLRARR
ncbi:MAG: hypothetical protein RL669_1437 [Pseudomonadota bacterium]